MKHEDRRRALDLAHRIIDGQEPLVLPPNDVHLIATALLAMYDYGRSHLAPTYAAAQALVRDDGSQDASAWFAFKDLVLTHRAHDREST